MQAVVSHIEAQTAQTRTLVLHSRLASQLADCRMVTDIIYGRDGCWVVPRVSYLDAKSDI